ncbi:MAG: protein translocase subunit SecD [Candidatus Dormibacteraeota bacterium]|nr:protein translocase subunit SecD [Candidatus Dormibacteraeota bacterium]
MRANRWIVGAAMLVALLAIFIDGYSYIWRAASHIPMSAKLAQNQFPNLGGKDLYIHKGLDLQGGTEIVLQIDPRSLPRGVTLSTAQASTVEVMNKRVNGIGVSEAAVASQGDRRVVVQLPGVDIDRATQVIGKTARLTFRSWVKAAPGPGGKLVVPNDATGEPIVDPAYVPAPEGGKCAGATVARECIPLGYLPRETGIDGSMVTSAVSTTDSNGTNAPIVSITLTDQGSTLLGQVTTPLAAGAPGTPENQMAIFLDNTMINNANVQGVLNQGSFQISGGNISSDATYRNDLASTLAAGRLPGKVSIVEANSVGATLGFDSVRRSFLAGALGLAVVVIFMIAYYRLPGLVASLALAFYAAVTLAAYKFIPVTLTLAGIAGFVLSVGMAVDANVLIFERLREELRAGRSLAAAAEAAERRAFPAIRDSNISTLITCLVLFLHDRILPFLPSFTVAKGFALTLGIGVIISFFSSVYVTQILLAAAIRIHSIRKPELFAVERMQ